MKTFFDEWVTTHNDAVFECYTPEMRAVRKAHLLLGLPDATVEDASSEITDGSLARRRRVDGAKEEG